MVEKNDNNNTNIEKSIYDTSNDNLTKKVDKERENFYIKY